MLDEREGSALALIESFALSVAALMRGRRRRSMRKRDRPRLAAHARRLNRPISTFIHEPEALPDR